MKRSQIHPLLSLVMATQMIISPLAYALNPLEMLNIPAQIIQQNQQNMVGQQQAQANQQIVAELTRPGRDKYFNTDSLARIPGLLEYMAQNGLNPATLTCPTLPTTLTEVRSEVCRIGVTNDRGVPPQAQLAEMFSLYKTYGDVAKQYEGYSSSSNAEGQGFGVGCMRNALQTLSGFFAYRINELDKLTTNLEALNNQFREASKVDLNAIEESTAVLEGGSSELGNEVRTRRPDLFDFGKRFDNPACKSMFAGDALNNLGNGRPGGLNEISKTMRDEFSAKPAGSKFSGESYIGAHGSVVDDINKMADKAAQQFSLNFTSISSDPGGFGEFASGIQGSVSSTNGLNSLLRGDFFADVQLNYSKQFEKIAADRSTLENELSAAGVNPQSALRVANNLNATNFESEVVLVQNQIRNGCLQRSFGGGSFWANIKKNIKDPRGSKFANKNEFNAIRERIESIMTNPRTTPEAKLAELRSVEQSEGSRFVLDMQGSYQKTVIQDGKAVTSNVSANQKAPSSYFNDIVSTCDAQFSTNRLGSAMTGSSAIAKLRELNQQYSSLATNQANNIRSEIRKKLIECETTNDASNQQAGSCTSDRFNTSSPGFCANAAFTCAGNMKSCSTQAQNFVKQIKTERTARVNNYKALVNKNKADIVKIFDTALAKYMKEGEMMRGLFGAGFTPPSGIQREVNGEGKFLDSFRTATQDSPDGALLLEDPNKYVEMFNRNIEKLKGNVQKQQQDILGTGGRGGLLAQHVDQTVSNYKTAMDSARGISNECIAKHDDFIRRGQEDRARQMAEMQKRQNELGERRQEVCELFNRAQSDANGACKETIKNVVGVSSVYGQFRDACRNNGFHQEAPTDRNSTNAVARATRICTQRGFDVTAESPSAPPAPSSKSASEKSSINADSAIRNLCTNFYSGRGCVARTTITREEDGERVSDTAQDCSTKYAQIVEFDMIAQNDGSQSGPASFPDAPAECSASFNGDRSVPEGSVEIKLISTDEAPYGKSTDDKTSLLSVTDDTFNRHSRCISFL
jgi:hypothetical protein